MHFTPGQVYHVYNRGNNRRRIFFSERNYEFFLEKIKNQLAPNCEILGWCLMPNHFHLLIYATQGSCRERSSFGGKPMQEIAYRIGILLSSYSQAINKQNGTTGSLFQQKTKAKTVSEEVYLVACLHYIHQNPWRAGLVNALEDWKYSSFRQYVDQETGLPCNLNLVVSLTGNEITDFYKNRYVQSAREVLENIW